jgi:hypothetical protein
MESYESINKLKQELGCNSVEDLLALDSENDPYYAETPGKRRKAEWFAYWWQQFNRPQASIRSFHYWLVSSGKGVTFPDGKPYVNAVDCVKRLEAYAKCARYLDMVDVDAISDEKKPDIDDNEDYDAERHVFTWVRSMPDLYLPKYMYNVEFAQRYHLEIWVEKSTMNHILRPIAQEYGAVLVVGKGEMSIPATRRALDRMAHADKPVRLFYLSDLDQGGTSMPKAVARKLQYFNEKDGHNMDIKLFRLAITQEQVDTMGILRAPLALDKRGRPKTDGQTGQGACELDALEGQFPGELERIVRSALDHYYDHSALTTVRSLESRVEAELYDARQAVRLEHQETITTLERLQVQFEEAWHELALAFETKRPVIDLDDLPEAAVGTEIPDPLFDSTLSYLEQNALYQRYKGNDEDDS